MSALGLSGPLFFFLPVVLLKFQLQRSWSSQVAKTLTGNRMMIIIKGWVFHSKGDI